MDIQREEKNYKSFVTFTIENILHVHVFIFYSFTSHRFEHRTEHNKEPKRKKKKKTSKRNEEN